MVEKAERKRGGERSVESVVSKVDHVRLEKARDDLYARIAGETISPLLQAVKDDLVSRAVDTRKKESSEPLTRQEIDARRTGIAPAQIVSAAKNLLLHVLLREQHNAQLKGKTKQAKTYHPDLATLADAVRDLTPQSAKKFAKVKSAAFLLEHHRLIIAQRIREMAGKDALLKPVEFIAETNDPEYYVGKLFYRGSFAKVSIIEENCVGTEKEYFEDSKVNPETGRPTTEIFVVMKRWEEATLGERRHVVQMLLKEQKTVDAIDHELWEMFKREDVDYATGLGGNTLANLFDAVLKEDDRFVAGKKKQKTLHARDILYRAATTVLNGEKKEENFPRQLPYRVGVLENRISLLPQFTDIPIITIEYNVAQNFIEQVKMRVEGEPDQPPSGDDMHKEIILSTLWEVARSERLNHATEKHERRRILGISDLQQVFEVGDNECLMLLKENGNIESWAQRSTRPIASPWWANDVIQECLREKNDSKDFELLGGTVRVDANTPTEILDALKDLSVNVEIRASATQEQLDKLTSVNGTVYIVENRDNDYVNLKNLVYAGGLDIRDNKKFRADKLEEVRSDIVSEAGEHYLRELKSVEKIVMWAGLAPKKGLTFVAPNLRRGVVRKVWDREFFNYDCPLPYERVDPSEA